MPDTYLTGELPIVGDVVRGRPNGYMKDRVVSGIVSVVHEGLLGVIFIRTTLAGDGRVFTGEYDRVYGDVVNFALMARN